MTNLPWFSNTDILAFPKPETALSDPDGLLAMGGNLSTTTLINAYSSGIFPWFDEDELIMWWSPAVRAIIPTSDIHVSKNMKKLIKQNHYTVKFDDDFVDTIEACSQREATWITDEMKHAYSQLHEQGIAHSVEVYDNNDFLVGGLYGVFINNCFCGESMFSDQANTSKLALITLANFLSKNGCNIIDCQLPTEHLSSMGAKNLPREKFVTQLLALKENKLLMKKKWNSLWQH